MKVKWSYCHLWCSFASLKVKYFTYLLLQNRILTHDNMLTRRMYCEAERALCSESSDCPIETIYHVFVQYRYTSQVWDCMGQLIIKADTMNGTWEGSWIRYKHLMQESKRIWTTRFTSVL